MDTTFEDQLFETVNFVFMWKYHLLEKKHRKVNFVIFYRRFVIKISTYFPGTVFNFFWVSELNFWVLAHFHHAQWHMCPLLGNHPGGTFKPKRWCSLFDWRRSFNDLARSSVKLFLAAQWQLLDNNSRRSLMYKKSLGAQHFDSCRHF